MAQPQPSSRRADPAIHQIPVWLQRALRSVLTWMGTAVDQLVARPCTAGPESSIDNSTTSTTSTRLESILAARPSGTGLAVGSRITSLERLGLLFSDLHAQWVSRKISRSSQIEGVGTAHLSQIRSCYDSDVSFPCVCQLNDQFRKPSAVGSSKMARTRHGVHFPGSVPIGRFVLCI